MGRNVVLRVSLIATILISVMSTTSTGAPLDREALYTTVMIRDSSGTFFGSGFTVTKDNRIYLISNKHVFISALRESNNHTAQIEILLAQPNGETFVKDVPLTTKDKGITSSYVVGHPNQKVDVAAVNISSVYSEIIEAIKPDTDFLAGISYNLLASKKQFRNFEINVGDEVLILGFPRGFRNLGRYSPLITQGVISTPPLSNLTLNLKDPRSNQKIKNYPAYIVDANLHPGSSGSMVILKPGMRKMSGGLSTVG